MVYGATPTYLCFPPGPMISQAMQYNMSFEAPPRPASGGGGGPSPPAHTTTCTSAGSSPQVTADGVVSPAARCTLYTWHDGTYHCTFSSTCPTPHRPPGAAQDTVTTETSRAERRMERHGNVIREGNNVNVPPATPPDGVGRKNPANSRVSGPITTVATTTGSPVPNGTLVPHNNRKEKLIITTAPKNHTNNNNNSKAMVINKPNGMVCRKVKHGYLLTPVDSAVAVKTAKIRISTANLPKMTLPRRSFSSGEICAQSSRNNTLMAPPSIPARNNGCHGNSIRRRMEVHGNSVRTIRAAQEQRELHKKVTFGVLTFRYYFFKYGISYIHSEGR